jgi:hypothetical protein
MWRGRVKVAGLFRQACNGLKLAIFKNLTQQKSFVYNDLEKKNNLTQRF